MSLQNDVNLSKRRLTARLGWYALASLGLTATGCGEPTETPPISPLAAGGSSGAESIPALTGAGMAGSSAGAPVAVGAGGGTPSGGTAAAGVPMAGTEPEVPEETGPDPAILEATEMSQARLLTQSEYRNSVRSLFGDVEVDSLQLPDNTSIAGFSTVGASAVKVNAVSAEQYAAAAQAIALEIFNNPERWQSLVGCEPQTDLSDSCVEDFAKSLGRRAFRRELTPEEVTNWVGIARNATQYSEEMPAEMGLAALVAGLLQSPNFLYRVEHAVPDIELGRIKFDGPSMATRLAYLITGSAPDGPLLDAAAEGKLSTPEGVRAAATELLNRPGAGENVSEFFSELAQLQLVIGAERDPELFPTLTDELRAAMVEEARLWLSREVLADGADVRTLFTSTTTYLNDDLAEFYDVRLGPGEGFREVELPPETGRAGILGKAAFLLAHSSADSSNPTRRGNFIMGGFTCIEVPPPPPDAGSLPREEDDNPKTTRERFEAHLIDETCVGCHSLMDPFGFALEHFDPIGAYRADEQGMPIDATGSFGGKEFDGALELGQVLNEDPRTIPCFVKNFYRFANAVSDDKTDSILLNQLSTSLAEGGHVWRELLLDFVASDAFTSISPHAELGVEAPSADEATE